MNQDIEDEHMPLAAGSGMGIVPWSPLAFGLLTGRYDRAAVEAGGLPGGASAVGEKRPEDDKRLDGASPFGDTLFTERNWGIVEAARRVAAEMGQSPARVALAWVAGRPGVASVLMGVSRAGQVSDNAAALDIVLPAEHREALDAVSALDPRQLYGPFTPGLRKNVVFGGSTVKTWPL